MGVGRGIGTDSLCIWQVQVSVYCSIQKHAHLIDICCSITMLLSLLLLLRRVSQSSVQQACFPCLIYNLC